MKKVVLFSVLAFLFSCSKEDNVGPSEPFNNGMLLLAKVVSFEDIETKTLVYNSLTSEEKYSLWTVKLTDRIRSNELSPIQASKLLEIKNYLTPEIFKEGDSREVFYTEWFPKWVTEAEKILSNEEIYFSILSINRDSKPKIESMRQNNLPPQAHACICALNSGFTCPKWSGGIWPTLNWGKCSVMESGCVETSSNCGALWDNECDGDVCDNTSSNT